MVQVAIPVGTRDSDTKAPPATKETSVFCARPTVENVSNTKGRIANRLRHISPPGVITPARSRQSLQRRLSAGGLLPLWNAQEESSCRFFHTPRSFVRTPPCS